jgi:hypothetical protein
LAFSVAIVTITLGHVKRLVSMSKASVSVCAKLGAVAAFWGVVLGLCGVHKAPFNPEKRMLSLGGALAILLIKAYYIRLARAKAATLPAGGCHVACAPLVLETSSTRTSILQPNFGNLLVFSDYPSSSPEAFGADWVPPDTDMCAEEVKNAHSVSVEEEEDLNECVHVHFLSRPSESVVVSSRHISTKQNAISTPLALQNYVLLPADDNGLPLEPTENDVVDNPRHQQLTRQSNPHLPSTKLMPKEADWHHHEKVGGAVTRNSQMKWRLEVLVTGICFLASLALCVYFGFVNIEELLSTHKWPSDE